MLCSCLLLSSSRVVLSRSSSSARVRPALSLILEACTYRGVGVIVPTKVRRSPRRLYDAAAAPGKTPGLSESSCIGAVPALRPAGSVLRESLKVPFRRSAVLEPSSTHNPHSTIFRHSSTINHRQQYRGRESNPHAPCGTWDFKSHASANSATAVEWKKEIGCEFTKEMSSRKPTPGAR